MPRILVRDNFYPGISLQRTLRRSPGSVIRLHEEILRTSGCIANSSNVLVTLASSQALYVFLSKEGKDDLSEYHARMKARRPIKGPVFLQFDIVIQIITALLKYASEHPGESIQTAAALAYLEERLEKKFGPIGIRIWKKLSAVSVSSSPKRQIIRLLRIRKPRKRKKASGSSTGRHGKEKSASQMKLG